MRLHILVIYVQTFGIHCFIHAVSTDLSLIVKDAVDV